MKDKDFVNAILAAAILDSKVKNPTTSLSLEKMKRVAEYLYKGYLAFQEAGFTDEQAFKLLITTLGRN